MSKVLTRVVLALLAFSSVVVGAWAAFAPRQFYDNFPGGGRTWVAPDGPYNEHLVRDVGELNLALTVVTVFALVLLTRALVLATAWAWLVYNVPHLVYHLRHLDPFGGGDKTAIPTSLALAVAGAVLLLIPRRAAREAEPVGV
ncbi:MAG: hypothetical protein QOI55_1763 [Actinomycetota bacterium]|jgi:hypothetical protein|nr:hypothetical protein [Actinomycetota bacterium]